MGIYFSREKVKIGGCCGQVLENVNDRNLQPVCVADRVQSLELLNWRMYIDNSSNPFCWVLYGAPTAARKGDALR